MNRRLALLLTLFAVGCSQPTDKTELSYAESPSATVVQPEGELHEHANLGYSIYLPAGWGPIAQDALIAQGKAVSGPALQVEYIAGYQVKAKELFVHPFVLVRQLPESAMPKEQIKAARQLFRNSGEQIARQMEENSGLKLNTELGVPVLEEETGIVWLKFQLDGVDGQRVEGLIAHYYVDGQILQFNAGTTVARAKEDWPVLERMLRTIKVHGR